jgi:hypothetical protein
MKNVLIFSLLFLFACKGGWTAEDQQYWDRNCRDTGSTSGSCNWQMTKTNSAAKTCSDGWLTSSDCMNKEDPNKDGGPRPNPGNSSGTDEGNKPANDSCEGASDCPGGLGTSGLNPEGDSGSNPNGGGGALQGAGDVFKHWGNEIGKAWNSIKDELNGNNAEKRRKEREGKRLLREIHDLWEQSEALDSAESADVAAIEGNWNGLNDSWKDFGIASREKDLEEFRGRYNSRSRGVLEGVPVADPSAFDGLGKGRGEGIYPEHKKVENGRKYLKYARGKLDPNAPDYEARKTLVEFGDSALDEAETSYREGNISEGNAWHDIGIATADAALSATPIIGWMKDVYEASTGNSLLTGKKLTKFERSMAAVGVVTLGLAKFGAIAKAGKIFGVMVKAAKNAEEAEKITKAGKEAVEIAETAAKAGIKDKAVIDEVAEAVKEGMPYVAIHLPKPSFFSSFIGIAYAADCISGSAENVLKQSLNNSAKSAKAFEERIAKLPPGERVAEIKGTMVAKAKQNGWTKDRNVSKKNGRDVYADGNGDYYSVDTQHGRYEKCNSRGKHQGEYDIDGEFIPGSIDISGGHDLKI